MKIFSPIRHCSTTAKRLALSVTIAGSLFASGLAPSLAHAKQVDPALTGGISILVHRFDEEAAPIDPAVVVDAPSVPTEDKATEAGEIEAEAANAGENKAEDAEAQPAQQAIISIPGTHDSIPTVSVDIQPESTGDELKVAAADINDVSAPATSVRRTSSDFNEMLAAVAASTAAKIGIPLEQFLEPFAMIRTQAKLPPVAGELDPGLSEEVADDQALAQAVALNRWWLDESMPEIASDEPVLQSQVVPNAVPAKPAPHKFTIDVREELAALAAEEPLDVTLPSVIVPFIAMHDFSKPVGNTVLKLGVERITEPEVAVEDPSDLAGSSPVIVTLEEAYLPYDLNEGDFHEAQLVKASPDCLLEEAVWQVSKVAEVAECFSPRELGVVLADVAHRRSMIEADVLDVVASDLASLIAKPVPMMLVDGEPIPQPVPDAEPDTVHSIDTMVVDGEVIPAPSPDAVPDELPNSAIIEIMLVDGDLVPAPTPDDAPDAMESSPAIPTMLVDGNAIPAPTPDGIPNGIVSLNTATGIESIVAVDVVPDSAYPELNPGLDPAAMDAETQLATRPEEDNVQR
ncbi:putative transmembrane protein [Rhodopirellula islandica]|uniref:Transmembrane protein n=1 Tax=Rhodopirellula islandica TaxID=595434 RepID=A0A0J1B8X0_RHOIS|nr:hypothetical protein [Rhodopirellula islandica]KLU03167.1 putative transmembrane protein [Rhodopirellula islandica]